MRKIVFETVGEADVLRLVEAPDDAPGGGEILVRNEAIGVNFIDIYQRRGLYPVALPHTPGAEAAGRIVALGAGVREFSIGDRVAFLAGGGAYASLSRVSAAMAVKIPDALPTETIAASFLKGLTAEMLTQRVYALKAGRSALIHAAAGGVGVLLTQWAAHLGAHAIAVVGAPEKAQIAHAAGAHAVIVRETTPDITAEVRRLTDGRGVDVVYDSVGAATFAASLDSLAPRGLMVSYGNASGPVPAFSPLELSRRGSLFLTRPSLFHYATPDALAAMADALFRLLTIGALRPAPPAIFSLADAAGAHRLLESGRSTGAIILKP